MLMAPTWHDDLRVHLRDAHQNVIAENLTGDEAREQHWAAHARGGDLADHSEPADMHVSRAGHVRARRSEPDATDLPVGQQSKGSSTPDFVDLARVAQVMLAMDGAPWDLASEEVRGLYLDKATTVISVLDLADRVARVRAQVVQEILDDLKPEIDWQFETYGNSKDPAERSAVGRLVGMQDAYRTVAKHRAQPAETSPAALPDVVGTPDPREVRDAQFDCIQAWAEARDVRGYLTFGDIEQLVTNLEALQYEVLTAAGGGEADQSNASDLQPADHPEARDA